MNLPNRLTLLRIFMVPLFMVFAAEPPAFLHGQIAVFLVKYGMIIAGAVFVAAFATDILDGFIARKRNLVTDFGIFLDPVADKLLVTAALVALASRGIIGAWVPVIIISRELIVTGMRLLGANKGVVLAAGKLGKAKTFVQFTALTTIYFQNFNIAALININAGVVLLYLATLLTLVSGADYIVRNRSLFA